MLFDHQMMLQQRCHLHNLHLSGHDKVGGSKHNKAKQKKQQKIKVYKSGPISNFGGQMCFFEGSSSNKITKR